MADSMSAEYPPLACADTSALCSRSCRTAEVRPREDAVISKGFKRIGARRAVRDVGGIGGDAVAGVLGAAGERRCRGIAANLLRPPQPVLDLDRCAKTILKRTRRLETCLKNTNPKKLEKWLKPRPAGV